MQPLRRHHSATFGYPASHLVHISCAQHMPHILSPAQQHFIASHYTPSIHTPHVSKPDVSSHIDAKFSKLIQDPPRNMPSRLCLSEAELVQRLSPYIISRYLLRDYGFPVECFGMQGCAEFWKPMFGLPNEIPTQINYEKNQNGGFSTILSPTEINFDRLDGGGQIFAQRQCTRCQRAFHVSRTGEYLNQESCSYHPDKFEYSTNKFICCGRPRNSEGCSNNDPHVWSGSVIGLNGPCTDFVQTLPNRRGKYLPTVFALDCEMSYTGRGLEVTKLSVVDFQGEVAYEHYVRPNCKIIDYNSRYSGITENDFHPSSGNSIKSLTEVHRDLLELFDSDTILIGHGLENDLRALRMVHTTIVDTSFVFPHPKGYPYKKGLKALTTDFLNPQMQSGDARQSCLENARASLELMLFMAHEST